MQLPYSFGKYVITRKLAKGGMAEIFRAKYLGEGGFEKTVAIKRLLSTWSADQNFITMLIDEAKVLVHLQHPNIVQIIELGKEGDNYFLSMELVDGLDLGRFFNRLVRDQISLPTKYTIYIISQILNALSFAHGKSLNIVHRDISPPNVLLSWNGEVKVADFGIAKGAHRTYETAVAQAKGKYSYMSPEQAKGEAVDQTTDLYAVGILLYELLTGKRLFDGPSDLEVIEKVKKGCPNLDLLEIFDKDLPEIVGKALQKKSRQRYQSASIFLKELNNYAVKNNLVITAYDFGQFISQTFAQEIVEDEAEQSKAEETFKQTKPISESQLFPSSGKKIKTFAVCLSFIFIPWYPYLPNIPTQPEPIVSKIIEPQVTMPKTVSPKTTPATPLPSALLSVQARPWGYITIPGFFNHKESPISNFKIKPGKYLVKVFYEPKNQWLSQEFETKNNVHTNCLAIFGNNPSLRCNIK
ncbi:MAG: serine/threonine-protein kinase [Pseudomonadota bacterium]